MNGEGAGYLKGNCQKKACGDKIKEKEVEELDSRSKVGSLGISDVPPRMLSPRNQLIRVILYNRTRLDCPFFGSPIPTLRW